MSDETSDKLINYLMDRTDKIGELVTELAKQLGVAAEHVYMAMIRQQMIYGVSKLVVAIPLLIFFIFCMKHFYKREMSEWKKTNDGGIGYGLMVVFGVLSFICLLVIGNGVLHLLSPEYYALKEIMELIRGNVSYD